MGLFNPAEAEFWVLAGLVIFLGIAFWKGRGAILNTVDAKAVKIRADLDEAARLREEAEALLASIKAQRQQSERQAAEMLANAEAEAKRMQDESRVKLEEQVARRAQLAERKIAQAEQQAMADVKAAAAEMAARAAEAVLAARVGEPGSDPQVDRAIERMSTRFQ